MYFSTVRRQRVWLVTALLVSIAGCSFQTPFPRSSAPQPGKSRPPTAASAAATPALSNPYLPTDVSQRYRVEVLKASRTLRLWQGEQLMASYGVALGGQPIGAKSCQGDSRTPEGVYTVSQRKADSRFHLALRLSYPNAEDQRRAAALGCEPGGDIMIHGLPNSRGHVGAKHRQEDWTDGCIALTNEEMDRLWALLPVGTRVEIRQ